jgi:hypothetical protein
MIDEKAKSLMNPYLAGFLLGLTLLASFLVLGTGIEPSGALTRFAAWLELVSVKESFLSNEYFAKFGQTPLEHYLVFMFAGIFIGGFLSALTSKRVVVETERGAKFSSLGRLLLALIGGIFAGIASQLTIDCISSQGLSGIALMQTGGILFLFSVFAGGCLSAWFFRRQWHD